MASLIQCDFCGNITNQIAARIRIEPVTPAGANRIRSQVIADNGFDFDSDRITKDCCTPCLSKFLTDKPVAIAITPGGEPVKQEDL